MESQLSEEAEMGGLMFEARLGKKNETLPQKTKLDMVANTYNPS
jgi:hypothetical protein